VRRKLDAALKVQVVLEASLGKRTITEIVSEYGVHPNENYCLEEVFSGSVTPHILPPSFSLKAYS